MVTHETRAEVEAQARRFSGWAQFAWNVGNGGAPITDEMAAGFEAHMQAWLANIVMGALDEDSEEGRARRRFLAKLAEKRVFDPRPGASAGEPRCVHCGSFIQEVVDPDLRYWVHRGSQPFDCTEASPTFPVVVR